MISVSFRIPGVFCLSSFRGCQILCHEILLINWHVLVKWPLSCFLPKNWPVSHPPLFNSTSSRTSATTTTFRDVTGKACIPRSERGDSLFLLRIRATVALLRCLLRQHVMWHWWHCTWRVSLICPLQKRSHVQQRADGWYSLCGGTSWRNPESAGTQGTELPRFSHVLKILTWTHSSIHNKLEIKEIKY